MADTIAVMNRGKVEQLGAPAELYERPATPFVAGFLGASNLLAGDLRGDRVVLADGTEIHVSPNGRTTGAVAAGVRPEKVRLGEGGGVNRLTGRVKETAYIGVATQVIVETPAGMLSVWTQNAEAGTAPPAPGASVTLTWSPEATFVVDRPEETLA